MKASLSVVVATYRREEWLIQTCETLSKHSAAVDAVIIIDQTPQVRAKTLEFREHLLERHPSWKWERVGWANLPKARNLGISLCQSDLVIFVDDDVAFDEGFLSAYSKAFENHPDAMSVVGKVIPPGTVKPGVSSNSAGISSVAGFGSETPGWVPGGRGCNMGFRKLAFGSHGIRFDEGLKGSFLLEETDVFMQMRNKGFRIWYDPACRLVHFGESSGGCSGELVSNGTRNLRFFLGFYYNHCHVAFKNLPFSDRPAFVWRAFRTTLPSNEPFLIKAAKLIAKTACLGIALTQSLWDRIRDRPLSVPQELSGT